MNNLHANREPAVSGSFYPSNPTELLSQINLAFKETKKFEQKEINAIIVPHAGYVFSGSIAATAYNTLTKKYKNIFLIGSSHHINIDGVSIYNRGNYQTPLGEVQVNKTIVNELMKNNSFISYEEDAHKKEHTLEVQLPFLQAIYKSDMQIVPIIMATSEIDTIMKMSKALEPYFNDENLFVISTDLSHYPNYEDAQKVDMNILNALTKNSPFKLIDAIVENESSKKENLQTSACGWSSLLTLLYLTQEKDYKYEILEYKNSGDTKYGEKDRVVGYGAMRVFKNSEEFFLEQNEKDQLKEIAKLSLYEAVINNKKVAVDTEKLSNKSKLPLGAFVTLYKDKKLKGCIGRFEPKEPLYDVITDMAISASRHDTRFTPVQKDELKDIEIEISVLTPRRKVNSIDEVIIGKHGIYVSYGAKNGTYLPKVATDMNWSAEEFVKSCCEQKAGIAKEDCKNAELYVYEAIVF
ncbi:AmmeMemoRadiSam system protein B [Sulfurimonas aquatica]|nr:AmmeMemoRadiSam system protein B [Sulfurimonas aquatica]